jgi:glycosyltransferase involved in cell wall biosynthesis
MTAKLTVLIPCKNERDNIRACIETARLVADEVLVADSLSTDDTLSIVRSMDSSRIPTRIIEREFVGYVDFKNWAIPQASHEWVLIVDADERVTPELAAEIRDVLADPPADIDAYWIRRRHFYFGREVRFGGFDTEKVCRLIRRDACRYAARRVHEEIAVSRRRSKKLKHRLDHFTIWTYDQFLAKRIHYTRLSAFDSWEKGRRTGFVGLLLRPLFRFFQLYVLRLGFLDGLLGIQMCMMMAFVNTFLRQARLWEMEHALPRPQEPSQASRRAA